MSINSTTETREIPVEPGIPPKLSELRWKLWNKAKQEPKFKFYTLYDRIYRKDVIETAYWKIRENKGSAGIDGITFEDIEKEEDGVSNLINQVENELKNKNYRPQPVKRVYIPKANGKLRPLGIPCIRDRLVQMAVLLIIEPIFEADFKDCSHGFRPKRNAHDAILEIRKNIVEGRTEVYDADLSSYFDTIEHEKLMYMIQQRIADRHVLKLIRQFLTAIVVEKDDRGDTNRSRPTSGTPQGGVISPLLSNIYLHAFDRDFEEGSTSPKRFANARLIRYADDFVIMARHMGIRIKEWIENRLEVKLNLKINKEKTRIVKLREEKAILNFLGYSFRYDRDLKGRGCKYLNLYPAEKSIKKMKEKIKETTSKSVTLTLQEAIAEINLKLQGWANYFKIGYPRAAFRDINQYLQTRFRRFLSNRSQRKYNSRRQGESHYKHLQRQGLRYL